MSESMIHLSSEWLNLLKKGKTTTVFDLDISVALDHVMHKSLAARLQSLDIEGGLLHVIIDYLKEKTLFILINGKCSSE